MTNPFPCFTQYLAYIVQGLYGIIAPVAARERARTPLLVAAICRLQRMLGRLERLVIRWRAGTLRKPRLSRAGKPRPLPPEKPSCVKPPHERVTVPSGDRWLIHIVQQTVQMREHLQIMLTDPELIAMLKDVPQAGRILRPLCRGLGLVPLPEPLRPPAPPPRAARPARLRPAAQPPKPRPPKLRLWPGPRLKNAVRLW